MQEQIIFFIEKSKDDPRISSKHISIYLALLVRWKAAGYSNPFRIFGRELKRFSKVSGRCTYLKCINELNEYGYIVYKPSFRNNCGSEIYFPKTGAIDV